MPRRRPSTTAQGYGSAWARLSRQARAQATHCAICGGSFTPEDPAASDHIDPVAEYGPRLPSPDRIQVVHRSCNSRRARLRERATRAEEAELAAQFARPAPREHRTPNRPPRQWIGALDAGPVVGPATVIKPGGVVVTVRKGQRYIP